MLEDKKSRYLEDTQVSWSSYIERFGLADSSFCRHRNGNARTLIIECSRCAPHCIALEYTYLSTKERIHAISRVQDGLAFPLDSYSNSQLDHQDGSMLSVIVQSDSGENSSATSSVHLPLENRDLALAVSPSRSRSRGRAEGPSHTGNPSERRLSLHRTYTSRSNITPPSPGGVAATSAGRSPKITLPRLG